MDWTPTSDSAPLAPNGLVPGLRWRNCFCTRDFYLRCSPNCLDISGGVQPRGSRGGSVHWLVVGVSILLFGAACGDDSPAQEPSAGSEGPSVPFLREPLLDPETCRGCHPQHYREWASSMHAYAAEDPVFIAMLQRAKRELGDGLGDQCVRCHAPMALREGATTDGLNLQEVPRSLRGVTCYFCHNAIDAGDGLGNPRWSRKNVSGAD